MPSKGLQLLLISLLFHVVYLNSIFSVYFRSQVVDVAERFKVETEDGERLAKRVVLIVGELARPARGGMVLAWRRWLQAVAEVAAPPHMPIEGPLSVAACLERPRTQETAKS